MGVLGGDLFCNFVDCDDLGAMNREPGLKLVASERISLLHLKLIDTLLAWLKVHQLLIHFSLFMHTRSLSPLFPVFHRHFTVCPLFRCLHLKVRPIRLVWVEWANIATSFHNRAPLLSLVNSFMVGWNLVVVSVHRHSWHIFYLIALVILWFFAIGSLIILPLLVDLVECGQGRHRIFMFI